MKPDRFWNTWQAAYPAEFSNIKSGLAITPLLYAASIGKINWLKPQDVKFGAHRLDGSAVSFTVEHAATRLAWNWQKQSPTSFTGQWISEKHGEWGLRFWVSLALTGGPWQWRDNAAICKHKSGFTALIFAKKPLLITAHENIQALAKEFETHGYWYLKSRAVKGKCLALRFNLDEMPNLTFAAGEGKSAKAAILQAEQSLKSSMPLHEEETSLTAMRDILGWNSLWDNVNQRAYTSCSRNWDVQKFGGFGIWLTDTGINALLLSYFDQDMAQENLTALHAHQTKAGNFPCLVTGHDAWPDRSQPPLLSLFIWMIYQRDGNLHWLQDNYAKLARNHAWWWKNRDGNHNGILEYGSSNIGDGLYVGTKLAAKDESFMDNSPMHDEAQWNEASRTLNMEDVGLNCLIALDAEILGLMDQALGKDKEAKAHAATAQQLNDKIRHHFWDSKRKVFANRLWSGKFADAITPTSFYPLLSGAADKTQVKAMLRLLNSQQHFGGKFGLASVARSHAAYHDDVYWRGRIWPILNWLCWLGLKRQGEFDQANKLRETSAKLFIQSWQDRQAPENFNADTGLATGPDTDDFYSWTALLPAMDMAGLVDIDPFSGWVLINQGPDQTLGPIRSPWGLVHVMRKNGAITILDLNQMPLFTSRKKGRIKVDYHG